MRRTTLYVLGLLPSVTAPGCAESAVLETRANEATVQDGGAMVGVDASAAPMEGGPSGGEPLLDAAPSELDAGLDATTPPARANDAGRTFDTDRATFFGAPRCDRDRFVLCEDFESEQPGQPADPMVWYTMGPRITVDDTRAARGTRSLHVQTGSTETVHFIRTPRVVPAARTRMWGRLFLWVAPPRPGKFSQWTVIEATGSHASGGTARVRFGGVHIPSVENRLAFNYDIWGARVPAFREVRRELAGRDTSDGVWHCLEWMMDGGQREARLFRDGVEETGLAVKESIDGVALDFPSFDGLNIGMANYQSIGADSWNVWIDEVAVDTQRIGCST